MKHLQQSTILPPAQPSYILRGHKAQVHALLFLRNNCRLLSGDASGTIILWDTTTKRARAVWKGHDGGVLGFGIWDHEKILSHGRDGRVKVWKLGVDDERELGGTLPVDVEGKGEWKMPWLLHSLQVYTLNFCQMAICADDENDGEILVATPAANEGATVVHSLPSEELVYFIPPPKTEGKAGMVMAVRILFVNGVLHAAIGFESGITSVQRLDTALGDPKAAWSTVAAHKPHHQPILSLDISEHLDCYFTSGADDGIAMVSLTDPGDLSIVKTKHSGQQSLVVRSDGKLFATAGWDGRMRVYVAKSMKEVALLKWHKEGCYAVAFADIHESTGGSTDYVRNAEGQTQGDSVVNDSVVPTNQKRSISTVRQRRGEKARETHWLAAGSKDGKVSLWDIF